MRRKKKSVTGPLKKLTGPLADYRKRMIRATVTPETAEVYQDRYNQVMEYKEAGDGMYETLLRYFQKCDTQVAATKRQVKSAVLHVLLEKGEPLDRAEADDLDFVLDGIESEEAARDPRTALTAIQVEECIHEAQVRGWGHTADYMELMYSICGRPMDVDIAGWRLEGLEKGKLNSPETVAWCHRKASALAKKRLGAYEPHYFWRKQGLEIAKRRKTLVGDGALFPEPEKIRKRASEVITFVAQVKGWTGLITGPHNLRHGAAASAWEEAWANSIAAVKERGQWAADTSAVRYGKANRQQPKRQN